MISPVLFTIQSDQTYRVVRLIKEGGMGQVYEAEQLGTHDFVKRVAIKVIRDSLAKQPEFVSSFIGEARLVADLIHSNIVQTYHLGESGGIIYMAMELIRGVNLEQFCEQLAAARRPLPLAVFIASRVCRGLAYAHAKAGKDGRPLGIVHRDVNPKNILMAFEGDVKLTDFGIAKAKGFLPDNEGQIVAGTAEFMSPEQADFQTTDKRSDLFSVGVVLAQLLLGKNIFHGPTPEDSRQKVLTLAIPDFRRLNPQVDDQLNEILRRSLARSPSQRHQSADELLVDFESYIYKGGYGPTNETLGRFIRELFDSANSAGLAPARGQTQLIEHTARVGERTRQTRRTTRATSAGRTARAAARPLPAGRKRIPIQ